MSIMNRGSKQDEESEVFVFAAGEFEHVRIDAPSFAVSAGHLTSSPVRCPLTICASLWRLGCEQNQLH